MAEFFYAGVTIIDTTKSVLPLVFFCFFTSILFSIRWLAMMCLRGIANDAKLRFASTYSMQLDCLKCLWVVLSSRLQIYSKKDNSSV